ncbi:GNAT family protein [Bacillaceae bacterium S4-13-58]
MPQEDEKGIRFSGDAQRLEVKWWGKGIVSESRELVYDYAFLIQNVDEIQSQAWTENHRSCRSMERVGFKLVKIEDVFNPKYQRIMCQSTYRLSKEDWIKNEEKIELSS